MLYNTVQLSGEVLKQAVSYSEKAPAKFMLKVRKNNGSKGFNFIPCEAWGDLKKTAIEHFTAGEQIQVEGELISGSYEKDGKKVYTLTLNVVSATPTTLPEVKEEEKEPTRKGWG